MRTPRVSKARVQETPLIYFLFRSLDPCLEISCEKATGRRNESSTSFPPLLGVTNTNGGRTFIIVLNCFIEFCERYINRRFLFDINISVGLFFSIFVVVTPCTCIKHLKKSIKQKK